MEMKFERDKLLVGGVILLLIILIGGYGYIQSKKSDSDLFVVSPMDKEDIMGEQEDEYVYVHVSGHVKKSGVYKLPQGSRVYEAIEMAGGATEEGDIDKLNLAQVLQDGQKVTIPGVNDEDNEEQLYFDTDQGKLNINTAPRENLESLTGIGPSKASAIVQYREENGPFSKIDDIKNVTGIGPATFEKIKDEITVN